VKAIRRFELPSYENELRQRASYRAEPLWWVRNQAIEALVETKGYESAPFLRETIRRDPELSLKDLAKERFEALQRKLKSEPAEIQAAHPELREERIASVANKSVRRHRETTNDLGSAMYGELLTMVPSLGRAHDRAEEAFAVAGSAWPPGPERRG